MNTKKYTTVNASRILTNDLYLASYLLNQGCELSVVCNNRNRVTFSTVSCADVIEMRELYRSGKALVDISSFRESLKVVRKMMYHKQRSFSPCQNNKKQLHYQS